MQSSVTLVSLRGHGFLVSLLINKLFCVLFFKIIFALVCILLVSFLRLGLTMQP